MPDEADLFADFDAPMVEKRPLETGLDLHDPTPWSPYKRCRICNGRYRPAVSVHHTAKVCSNACRMKLKKKRKREGPEDDLMDLHWKPWTYVKKRNPE